MAARFELGRAFEGIGDRDRARAAWEVVAAVDRDFCEVGTRLAQLDDSGAKVTVAGPSPEAAYESFDDLIAEANADLAASGLDSSAEPVTDPGDSGDSDAPNASSGPKKKKKKKKKISFA